MLFSFRSSGPIRTSSHSSRPCRENSIFAAFFPGCSVVKGRRSKSSIHGRKAVRAHSLRSPLQRNPPINNPVLRPSTSTRSLIDPSASPASYGASALSDAFEDGHAGPDILEMAYVPSSRTFAGAVAHNEYAARETYPPRYQRTLFPIREQKKEQRRCFPNVRNRKIRRKLIGSLVSGVILIVILTLCTPLQARHPFPHGYTTTDPTVPYRSRPRNL